MFFIHRETSAVVDLLEQAGGVCRFAPVGGGEPAEIPAHDFFLAYRDHVEPPQGFSPGDNAPTVTIRQAEYDELTTLAQQAREASNHRQDMATTAAALSREVLALTGRLNEADAKNDTLETDVVDLQNRLSVSEAEFGRMMDDRDRLKLELTTTNATLKRERREAATLAAADARRAARLEAAEAELDQLRAEKAAAALPREKPPRPRAR